MSSRKAIPAPLLPYLRLPPETALVLLTCTLGSSSTWLTSRFAGDILSADGGREGAGEKGGKNGVVLVSWLRDEKFWRAEIRRATGLDTAKLSSTGHFAFVDGLTSLATAPREATAPEAISKDITLAISRLSSPANPEKRITLVLDQPDAILATAAVSTPALNHMILTLRSKVHSAVVTLSADLPLVSAAAPSLSHGGEQTQPTPLETEAAAFLVQQAHAASFVMGVRELDTGAARDVSGVLRVTRGGNADAFAEDEDGDGEEVREMEALFFVAKDGGVRVFERGSAG